MVDLATLALRVDASGMTEGDQALDRLAAKGAATEAKVEKSMAQIGRAAKGAGTQVQAGATQAGAGLTQLDQAATKATGGANRLGPAMVNAGFQVQDFAVQVASGQSAMTAFAQQFPQLMGVLGFSGKLAIAGAAMGTLAAVGMAVAPMLLDMRSAADKAKDAIGNLTDAIDLHNQYAGIAVMGAEQLAERFGMMGASAGKAAEMMAEINKLDAITAMDAAVAELTERFGGLSRVEQVFTRRGQTTEMLDTILNLMNSLELTKEQADAVVVGLEALSKAKGIDEQAAAAILFTENLEKVFGSLSNLPPALRQATQDALRLALAGGEIVDPAERARIEMEKSSKAAGEIIEKYARQAEAARILAIYGKDSAQAEDLKRVAAAQAAEAYIQQHGLTGQLAQNVRDAANAAVQSEIATVHWANAMAGVKAEVSAIVSVLSQIGGGMISNAAKYVEINALKAGKSLATAAKEAKVYNLEMERNAALAGASSGPLGVFERATINAKHAVDMKAIALDDELVTLRKSTAETERAASAKSRGAGAAAKQAAALEREADKWRSTLSPMEKYRVELDKLRRVQGQLTSDEYQRAVRELGLEFADSVPIIGQAADAIAGFVSGSIRSFGDLLDSFKDMIRQMIATAIANPIKLALVGSMTGSAGAASASTGGGILGSVTGLGGSGGGILGGLLGSFGSSGIGGPNTLLSLGGGSGLMGGLGNAISGGLGNLFSIGANASLAGGGLMATLGAALGPIALIAGVGSLIKGLFGRKLKDTGIEGSFDNEGFSGSSYKFYKGGLLRSNKTTRSALDAEVADAIGSAFDGVRDGVLDMAGNLDLGTNALADFAHEFKFSTKGLSEDEILERLQEEMQEAGNGMAELILGTKEFSRTGEAALDTLTRLSSSLTAVRAVADLLGHSFTASGLVGGDLASNLADAFGGIDAMASAAQNYWQGFYTEQERLETLTRQTSEALAELGVQMPQSRDEYRAMIEALDLGDESTHELYAALMSMAGVMDSILPSVGALTAALAALQGDVVTNLDAAILATNEAAKASATAAANWYKATGSIRDYITKLRGTASALTHPARARANNEAQYQVTLARAMAGDLSAAQEITGAADRLLSSVYDTAQSQAEAAVAEARILADLGKLAVAGDIEGARHDIISGLLGQQAEILTETRDYIAAGNALTEDMIATLQAQLGTLDEAIVNAANITFASLQKSIPNLVDMAANTADVLRLIAGPDGMIRVGPVSLTQSAAFSTWYESTTRNSIATPMTALRDAMTPLRSALEALRAGIVAEGQRQAAAATAAAQQARVSALNSYVAGLTSDGNGGVYASNTQLAEMRRITGLTGGGSGQALGDALAGWSGSDLLTGVTHDPGGNRQRRTNAVAEVSRIYEQIKSLMTRYGVTYDGGLSLNSDGTARIGGGEFRIDGRLIGGDHPFARAMFGWAGGDLWSSLYAANRTLRNIPAFALGGYHTGGLRLVGENGPELEATGPSRIYTAAQTQRMLGGAGGDMAAVVLELRAVKAELAEIKSDQRRELEHSRDSVKVLKRMDAVGVKIDPDQNSVKAE